MDGFFQQLYVTAIIRDAVQDNQMWNIYTCTCRSSLIRNYDWVVIPATNMLSQTICGIVYM